MQKKNKRARIDHNEQQAIVRLIKLSFALGDYYGSIKNKSGRDILDIPHPFVMSKRRSSRTAYEELLGNIAPEQVIVIFREGLKNELEGHYWGRLLFYIIKGGKRIDQNKDVYLSPLPKLFYPIACLSPTCKNILKIKLTAKDIQSNRDPIQRCSKCKDSWASARDAIEKAIDIIYPCFGSKRTPDVALELATLYQGYITLCQYLDTKEYKTRASIFPKLVGLDTENLSLACKVPTFSHVFEVESIYSAFDEWPSERLCLPAKYFQTENICNEKFYSYQNICPFTSKAGFYPATSNNLVYARDRFKYISPFISRPGNDPDDPGLPLRPDWKPDPKILIRLKDLDLFVKPEYLKE